MSVAAVAVAVHFHCKHDNWKTVLPFDFKLTELMNINKMQVKFENQHDRAIFFKVMLFFFVFFTVNMITGKPFYLLISNLQN